jgi:hypothetical protein
MQISTIKELKALLQLCRQQGVTEISLGEVNFKLGELPEKPNQNKQIAQSDEIGDPYKNFPQGDLTPEQLMFYSAGGIPEEDPYLETKETA